MQLRHTVLLVKYQLKVEQDSEVGPSMLPVEQVCVYVQNPHCEGKDKETDTQTHRHTDTQTHRQYFYIYIYISQTHSDE